MHTTFFHRPARRLAAWIVLLLSGSAFTLPTLGCGLGPPCFRGGLSYYANGCGFGRYTVRPYASHYYPRTVSYGHYRGGIYYRPSGFYRPFPYPSPRIYVWPQKQRSCHPGPRRIIVYHLDPPEPASVEGPRFRDAEPPPEAYRPPPRPNQPDPENAWAHLEAGQTRLALQAFTALALRQPDEVSTRLGYGLAAALAGDKITAAYALRQAFESQPAAAATIRLPSSVVRALEPLVDEYSKALEDHPGQTELRFLAAVMLHFQQESGAARDLLASSIDRHGDDAPSTRRLLQAIPDRPEGRSLTFSRNE